MTGSDGETLPSPFRCGLGRKPAAPRFDGPPAHTYDRANEAMLPPSPPSPTPVISSAWTCQRPSGRDANSRRPGRLRPGRRGEGARDPTRLAVAWRSDRAGPACVCDLAWIVGRDEKLVSHHVRALRRRPGALPRARQDGHVRAHRSRPRAVGRRDRGAVTRVSAPVELPLLPARPRAGRLDHT